MRSRRLLLVVMMVSAAVFMLAVGVASANQTKIVKAGSNWVVEKTTELSSLTLAEGASVSAAKGHSVTMTVDGVQMDIKAGTYRGEIVLTVTEKIQVQAGGMGSAPEFRTAIYVNDGKLVSEKSVLSNVVGGTVTGKEARNIAITSKGENFNGIMVEGDSKYALINPVIYMEGNGGDDSIGLGAAVRTAGNAELTMENAMIKTRGAIRSGLFVCGNSTVHINNSTIECYDGIIPEGFLQPWEGGTTPNMAVPWMLGLSGNVRSTNVIEGGTVYYTNSHFKSQGWGVLSTDGPTNIHMVVTNCTIDNLESGYGAFTIGNCLDTFSNTTFNVADIGLIVTGYGSALITDGTVINSRRFGIMMHTNDGKFGTVTINKGSEINSRSTAIEIKGRGVKLDVEDATINPGNGILIEALPNDDPFVGGYGTSATVDAMLDGTPGSEKIGGMGAGVAMTMGPSEDGAAPGGAPGGPGAGDGPPGGAPPGDAPGGPGGDVMPGQGGGDPDDPGGKMSGPVLADFKNMTLLGDIVNARTHQGSMEITLEKTSLQGAITTAVAEPASHRDPSKEMYFMIGEFKNIFQPTGEKYGLTVSIDKASKWVVDQTSYLTGLTIAKGATVTTPAGFSLKMMVNGVEKPLKAGAYKGNIVLQVTPDLSL